jgi:hypothetical protein
VPPVQSVGVTTAPGPRLSVSVSTNSGGNWLLVTTASPGFAKGWHRSLKHRSFIRAAEAKSVPLQKYASEMIEVHAGHAKGGHGRPFGVLAQESADSTAPIARR